MYYFRETNLSSENLEGELEERILEPLLETANKKFISIAKDYFNVDKLQKVWIDGVGNLLDIHMKRLGIDFKLVQNRTNFTREYKYGKRGIINVIKYFLEPSGSVFDVIIRIMTDPIVGTEVKVFEEMLGYGYIDLWNILEKENLLPREVKT